MEVYKNYICSILRKSYDTQEKEDALPEIKDDLNESKPSNENLINENLMKFFECPVCFEIMAPPKRIYACLQTHLICSLCLDNILNSPSKSCPRCRQDFTETKPLIQYTSEQMLEELLKKEEK